MSQAIERYGIDLADLDPTRGREIAKTRPVVVVSLTFESRRVRTQPFTVTGAAFGARPARISRTLS